MQHFRAYRAHSDNGKITSRFDTLDLDSLSPGDVVLRVAFSDINYKDALAATGAGKIMKRLPMVVGIDVAGHVHSSRDPRFKEGDPVVVVGCGLGEEHDGGYAEYARVPGDWIVRLPNAMSLRDTMALGTAGFTAGMAVQRMEDNGQHPDHGPILVTGATGGVGSLAVSMLASLGYHVAAFTSKETSRQFLEQIGATEIVLRNETDLGQRPLEKALWGGAIDNVGGDILTWLTRTVKPLGNIAAIGLAASPKLNTTVMPFILRGINLLGINSTYCPGPLRERVWARLASDLRPQHLAEIAHREIAFDELPGAFDDYIAGTITGRTVVRIETG